MQTEQTWMNKVISNNLAATLGQKKKQQQQTGTNKCQINIKKTTYKQKAKRKRKKQRQRQQTQKKKIPFWVYKLVKYLQKSFRGQVSRGV